MPEGPEVKRNGLQLAKHVGLTKIKNIEILSGRYSKKTPDGLLEYSKNLPDKILGVGVHGKFIYIITSSGYNIWSTLGMTGRWSVKNSKHSRIKIDLEKKPPVYFEDVRNFGTFKIVYGKDALLKKIKSLGPDMLSGNVTNELFIERLRKKNSWNICKALMNQSVVSGIGNYIKSEALWFSGLNPHLTVSDLTDEDLAKLNESAKQIMKISYDTGGATFKNYRGLNDEIGNFSERFACYSRNVDIEGNKVVKEKTPDGRTTFWVPEKQGN